MPDMRISLMKGETIPRDIKGRRIICCFCNDKGTWDTKTLEKFAKRFPEAKEWYLHKLPERLRYPGQVLFCPGNNENTIVAIMICRRQVRLENSVPVSVRVSLAGDGQSQAG